MSQLFIVTTPQNSGEGTPLATAFNYTNSNFSELYARYQVDPPATLIGQEGDVAGMYASDSSYFYYCFANYDGSTTIWAQVTQIGNIAVAEIQNGDSNVAISGSGSNVTIGVNGTSNVVVVAPTGTVTKGIASATGNVKGNYILGNGSLLTGLPATYTDSNVTLLLGSLGPNNISSTGTITSGNITGANVSAIGNVTGTYILGDGSFLTGLPELYGNTNVASFLSTFGSNAINTSGNIITTGNLGGGNIGGGTVSVTGNVTGGNIITTGNVNTQGVVSAIGNIITDGYFVGTFFGNVTGNFVVPGSNTQVLFNTSGNADAVGGFTFDKDSNTLTILGNVVSQNTNTVGNVYAGGFVSASGNITASANINGLANIVASGTISTGNALVAGTFISAQGNIVGAAIYSDTVLSAAGNITGANINTTGTISTTGTIRAVTYNGTGMTLTGIVNAASLVGNSQISGGFLSVAGNVTGASLVGAIATASQTAITAIGTLSSLSVTANIQGGNLRTAGQISATGNIAGGNLTISNVNAGGNVAATNYTGTTLSVAGNVTGGNVATAGIVSATGNVTGNYLIGNIAFTTGIPVTYTDSNVTTLLAAYGSNSISTTGTITSASTVGGVIRGSSVSTTGTVTGGNIITGGNISAGGNVFVNGYISATGNLYVANIVSSQTLVVDDPLVYFSANTPYPYNYSIGFYSAFTGGVGNTYQHTGLVRDYADGTWKLVSNVPEPAGSSINFTNAIYDPLWTGALSATTGAFTSTVSATGNITGGNITTAGVVTVNSGGGATAIVNGGSNAAGNIGSSSKYFNTVFATATTALYADLAEVYESDADYEPGTVVVFGGDKEITTTTEFADVSIAGAISTNPAYLMNSATEGLPVALRGRIPVKVVGPVHKGDLLVTAGANPGYAISIGRSTEHPLAVFAKSIETNTDEGVKVITAVIL